MRLRFQTLLMLAAMLTAAGASLRLQSQTVQPIISEYTGRAEGFLEVRNDGISPEIVLLEPKSFSVSEDGIGVFRQLDPTIHVDLSATSLRLEPQQTARIFYKIHSDTLPAWLCIYSIFTPVKKVEGINVRVMLPHTVYLYQKESLPRSALNVSTARYDAAQHRVICNLQNVSDLAARAEQVEVTARHGSATQGGFPMLPQLKRTLSIEWMSDQPPETVIIHFPKFDVKVPVSTREE